MPYGAPFPSTMPDPITPGIGFDWDSFILGLGALTTQFYQTYTDYRLRLGSQWGPPGYEGSLNWPGGSRQSGLTSILGGSSGLLLIIVAILLLRK